jgi:hypothetical protein
MFSMADLSRVNHRNRWTDRYRKAKSEIPPHFQVIERLAAQHGIDAEGVAAIKRGIVKQWATEGRAMRDYLFAWWVDPSVIIELPREMFKPVQALPALRPGEWNIRDVHGRKVRLTKSAPIDRMRQAENNLRSVARSLLLANPTPYREVSQIVRCAEGLAAKEPERDASELKGAE